MYQTSRYIRFRIYTIAINYWNFWPSPKKIFAKVHEGNQFLGKGQFLLLEIADLVKTRYLSTSIWLETIKYDFRIMYYMKKPNATFSDELKEVKKKRIRVSLAYQGMLKK
ncbi:hypothetical protein COF80_25285 [Bacillus toyonensis]|uniref:Uncharacterized protein n=1 Tax=Bacillus toyonensis TaxID=155322 RepID=A0AB73R3T0_9BACI|nr:hypothetical protein [Bacillus toyonensis]PEI81465.1 hypothetical protein CN678_31345 [Bacillus toyonensis]PEK51796.1 hypothetical protein CN586_08130 [Bacillus toyonensis]PEM45311.1 hypothetical protein CN636_09970 [Bacillus toyonensis]PGB54673.1 hypothetical protein COM00_29750 [Bacillus toyonensis]PHE83089.1 hypothetical protein COF80_25285 [Bacillus toyonensis]